MRKDATRHRPPFQSRREPEERGCSSFRKYALSRVTAVPLRTVQYVVFAANLDDRCLVEYTGDGGEER